MLRLADACNDFVRGGIPLALVLTRQGGPHIMMRLRKQTGFTLIELLIVVAIIGIIAAIAIPNLLNAIDRGKQKRTMADMRTIGAAVESYSVDVSFPPAGPLRVVADRMRLLGRPGNPA
jgi:prepilin-type N-terminal cleavage/methylation domain-containing protein